jgi:hypothetical protein
MKVGYRRKLSVQQGPCWPQLWRSERDSRPGGVSPICYSKDVTQKMIDDYTKLLLTND